MKNAAPATIRASSAPLAIYCPGSVRAAEVPISIEHEAAGMGTAAHDAMARIVHGLSVDIADLAQVHGVNPDELGMLVRFGRKAWDELSSEFGELMAEQFFEAPLATGVSLTGHPDLLSVIRLQRRAVVADYKFGRLDQDYKAQLMAYAVLVFEYVAEIDECDLMVVWMRDQDVERYRVTRAEALAWRERFIKRVVNWDGVYHPGQHCAHCPRSHECPALVAMARRDLEVFGGPDLAAQIERGLEDMPAATIVELRRKAKVIETLLKSLDEATRTVVRKRGPLDSGDGQVLKFVESERREVNTLLAWPVLHQVASDEEIAERVTVSLSAFEKLVATKAGRGKGAGAVREFAAALEATGAVTKVTIEQLRLVRK